MENKKRKKIIRKHVSIVNQEMVKSERITQYNKFQIWLAKVFKLQLADTFQYLFRIQYKGSAKLKVNDIVINSEGNIFICLKEENRLAMLVSKDASVQKPMMFGTLTIIEKPKK